MSLLHLAPTSVDESHLAQLVAEGASESKTLEFKQVLVLETNDQKREFLSDLTALANSDGGDLLFGMRAEKGVATELVGLSNFVADDALGRIENLLRDFVQPRLGGIQPKPIPLTNGKAALLIRVPRSFAAPHMVRHQGVTRFCGRNSNGKYDLDVFELRSAFIANEGLADRLKAFRIDRINRLVSGDTTVALSGKHLLVLHILPVVGARANARLTTAELQTILNDNRLRPIGSHGGWGGTFSFDGILVTSSSGEGTNHAALQIFRSGFLEAVEGTILEPRVVNASSPEKVKFIPSVAWEQRILERLSGFLQVLASLGLPPPYVASISLLNIRGFAMAVDPRYCAYGARLVDRDHLLTDEILIEDASRPPEELLRPLFDQVWNACGWERSINYDESGRWGRRA